MTWVRLLVTVGAWLVFCGAVMQWRLAERDVEQTAEDLDLQTELVREVQWWRIRSRARARADAKGLLTEEENNKVEVMRRQRNAWAMILGGTFWLACGVSYDLLLELVP